MDRNPVSVAQPCDLGTDDYRKWHGRSIIVYRSAVHLTDFGIAQIVLDNHDSDESWYGHDARLNRITDLKAFSLNMMATTTSHPNLDSKEAIVAHLEDLARASFAAVNDRDFSAIEGMKFKKPIANYSKENRRYTPLEKLHLAKHICQAHPEYHLEILDIVTTLEVSTTTSDLQDNDVESITRASSSVLYERTGHPPGIVTNSVLLVRYNKNESRSGKRWAVVSYETMPGGSIWGGVAV